MSRLELLNKLRQVDEITVLELLEITTSELVDAFLDKIDERLDYLYEQISEEDLPF